jgi:hypothetical protein
MLGHYSLRAICLIPRAQNRSQNYRTELFASHTAKSNCKYRVGDPAIVVSCSIYLPGDLVFTAISVTKNIPTMHARNGYDWGPMGRFGVPCGSILEGGRSVYAYTGGFAFLREPRRWLSFAVVSALGVNCKPGANSCHVCHMHQTSTHIPPHRPKPLTT